MLTGGWSRLKNHLSSNGLAYQGSKVPTVATEIPAAIKEIIAAIESEGGDITTVPKKALSFTILVKELESRKLLKKITPGGPPGPPGPPTQASEQASALSAAFRKDVPNMVPLKMKLKCTNLG